MTAATGEIAAITAELEEVTAELRHRWWTPSGETLAERRTALVARLGSLAPSPELLAAFQAVRQMDAELERFLQAERAQMLAQQAEAARDRQRVRLWHGALVEEANHEAAKIVVEA